MKVLKAGIASVVVALAIFAGVTWWALESSDVAIIETHAQDGSIRATHVWYAEPDGQLWLEAGTPDNPWYRDVLRNPELSLATSGGSARYLAEPVPGDVARDRVRALLHEKYGLRDSWVGLFVDSTKSVAVRLTQRQRGR